MYRITAVRDGKIVLLRRYDVTSAFATARTLRAMGWTVSVRKGLQQ